MSDDTGSSDTNAAAATDEQHDWVTSVLGVDPRDAVYAAGAAMSSAADAPAASSAAPDSAAAEAVSGSPAPLPSPGFLEEAEEVVESGIRAVVQEAPAVLEATETVAEGAAVVVAAPALLPIAAGVAVGAAVLLWSSDAGAAWDGATNPETGKPYTSQEEYDRVQANKKGKTKNPPVVQPETDPWADPGDEPAPKPDAGPPTCGDLGVDPCGQWTYETEKELLNAPENQSWVRRIVGGPNSQGGHNTYYSSKTRHDETTELGSTRTIQCCLETSEGARVVTRWVHAP